VTIERFQPHPLLEATDGVGAFGYVFIGLLGLLAGVGFLSNVVSLGVTGNLISGGTIPLLNLVVGVEVAASFAILASEFLDQTAVIRPRRR
jgi:multicomponent Na+:H+ antiporter subunit B